MTGRMRWTLLCVGILAGGCSSEPSLPTPSSISGKISLKGKPLPNVVVGFNAVSSGLPAKNRYVSAKTGADGKYSIAEIYPAEYQVTLVEDLPAPDPAMAQATPGNPALAKFQVPNKLGVTVESAPAIFDYDVR